MFIRKFYNIDAPAEVATTGGSIASIMAKSGVLKQPGEEGPAPSINTTEKKEEPTTAPAPPADATAATNAEKASLEPPKPTMGEKKETPQTAAPEKIPTWQEVLKSQQPENILKELGFGENLVKFLNGKKDLDPKMIGFFNHWETNDGNVEPYLRALTTDFSKMKPEDVMRYQLQVDNPELDAKQLDRLFKLKVTDRYKLDPQLFTEEEVQDGMIELMADVKPIRTTLANKQQELLLSKPAPKQPEVNNELQEQQQRQEAYRKYIQEHPAVKNFLASKMLSYGEGDEKFDYLISPEDILEILTDDAKWAESMYIKHELPDGSTKSELDVESQLWLGALLKNRKDFLAKLSQHFKNLGGQKAIAPIENARPTSIGEPAKSEKSESSPAAAAAKRGRLVPGNQ